MQLFMWQRNVVGVAHCIKDCFEVLGALDDAPDAASPQICIGPGGWIAVIQSFVHALCLMCFVLFLMFL